jgi:phosphatidylserine/phosphatidylglycerophosphate/cardiolipin synthase-like enzyme
MRHTEQGNVLVVRAIGGLHVVTLAWDFAPGQEAKRDKLLGFAIERTQLAPDGTVFERFWLRGIKRFEKKDQGLPPGSPVPTSEHPVQSFQWGDYTVDPKTTYRYRLVPVYGKPNLIELDEASATTVEITTEGEEGAEQVGAGTRHDIYFNRGVAGSQAYARLFPDKKPDQTKPDSEQMKWLSRGLYEALLAFISHANSPAFKLRAMLYEFRYAPVGEAFKKAAATGADVRICYEAQSYKDDNEAMIAATGIGTLCQPQKVRDGIRHNKFIVLVHNDVPVAVWTGSTNISAGGIFGHSNVGHAVWNREVARRYLDYWDRLADPDVKPSKLKTTNLSVEPTPALDDLPPTDRILTLYCLRDDAPPKPPNPVKPSLQTLRWYARRMATARRIMCMTFAFNFDPIFQNELDEPSDALRYLVFDKALESSVESDVTRSGNTVVAVGAKLGKGELDNFRPEVLTGFNKNQYIHDKFILIDPLGDDPIVVTGTANFSGPSQDANDENMLVIRGDKRVADIYFGEFMRIFDHLYSRYVVEKLHAAGKLDPKAGYLKEKTEDWVTAHFKAGSPKERRRRFFMGA